LERWGQLVGAGLDGLWDCDDEPTVSVKNVRFYRLFGSWRLRAGRFGALSSHY